MSAYRAFMIYDYQRNFFFMFIRKGFQVTPKWNGCRKELENKLVEMQKEPSEEYELTSDYGKFKCKYDKKNKCYFILLCSEEVKLEKQIEVLNEIYELIQQTPNYQKIKKDDLEQKQSTTINKLLSKKEQEYIEQYGQVKEFDEPQVPQKEAQKVIQVGSSGERDAKQNQPSVIQSQSKIQSQINNFNQSALGQSNNQLMVNTAFLKQNHHGFNSEKDLCPDTLIKIFRCFMMWDYGRQFFFMFIRKGFPIDKTWTTERCKLEAELKAKQLDPNDPKAKPKEPPETFDYKGDFGLYKAKYDKKTKCFFILLSRFKTKEEPQIKLLDALYDDVTKVEKYCSMKYDVLETKKKHDLEKIIDEHEKQLSLQVSQQFIDQKILESKIGKLYSPERMGKNQSVSPRTSHLHLSSKKSSIFMSQGQLQQQYQLQDVVMQEQEDIPEFTEQGQLANKMSLYQSKKINVALYVKPENE